MRLLWRRFRTRAAREGFLPAAWRVLSSLIPEPYWIYEFEAGSCSAVTESTENTTLRSGKEYLVQLRAQNPLLPPEFFRDEAGDSVQCIIAAVEGKLAGVAWACDWRQPGRLLRMSKSEAEVRSVYSLPQYRGRGIATNLVVKMCRQLVANGYVRVYAVIHQRNGASLRTFEKAGFRPLARVYRSALLGPPYRPRH